MIRRLTNGARSAPTRVLLLALVAVLAAGAALLLRPAPAEAHCDSVNGPVVLAARRALEAGDVALVLPYVQPEAEAELTVAFEQTLEVRALGGKAQELADRYFYETAVRLHRAGEGAPYTGLKEEADFGPALEAAEQALETGSLADVYAVLDETIRHGVEERYHAVLEARERAAEEGTVEANRERVAAELAFEQYVFQVHQAALGAVAHGEGTPADADH